VKAGIRKGYRKINLEGYEKEGGRGCIGNNVLRTLQALSFLISKDKQRNNKLQFYK
jgi:hypothetical protein